MTTGVDHRVTPDRVDTRYRGRCSTTAPFWFALAVSLLAIPPARAVADTIIPRDPDSVLVCSDQGVCLDPDEAESAVCDASSGGADQDDGEVDLDTRRIEARVNGQGEEQSAFAELVVTFSSPVSFPATINAGAHYFGQLKGGGGTRRGTVRIIVRLVEMDGGIQSVEIGGPQTILDRTEDGSFGNTVTTIISSASDAVDGTLQSASFSHDLEAGTIYGIVTRLEVEARGFNTFSNFRTGDARVDVGCAEIIPNLDDTDGDGLFDAWENDGLDMGEDGFLNLAGMGADALHKDIFLELDWLQGQKPTRIAVESMKDAFAAAPVSNPDGVDGINLWVDTGSLSDGSGTLGDDLGGGNEVDDTDILGNPVDISGLTDAYYAVRSNNFDANRRYVFRYGLSYGSPANDTGTSTGGNTGTTLNDTNQSWLTDEWAGRTISITGGTNSGNVCNVASNTGTQITISGCAGLNNWATVPDTTSTYAISGPGNVSGTSTGGNTGTTLNDMSQSWTTNQFTGQSITITGGTNSGDVCQIVGNTATQVTISSCNGAATWATTPDATSTYRIGGTGGQASGPNFVDYVHDPATVMHELGHTLGLGHGGRGDSRNCKPNYMSVMNYRYQPGGIPVVPGTSFGIDWDGDSQFETIDYSPPRFGDDGRAVAPLPDISEESLNEGAPQDPTDPAHQFIFVNGQNQLTGWRIDACVDWDGVGGLQGTCVSDGTFPVDAFVAPVNTNVAGPGGPRACNSAQNRTIEGNATGNALTGNDDWSKLRYNFRLRADFEEPLEAGTGEVAPTLEDYQRRLEALNTTDLVLNQAFEPGFTAAGQDVTLRLSVRNVGPNVAREVVLTNALAPEFTAIDLPQGCTVNAQNVLRCEIGQMDQTDEAMREIELHVAADIPCDDAQIRSLENTAEVENTAGPDANPDDNVASGTLRVLCIRYEYVAKLVCGSQPDPEITRLARGWYATSVNVHNPNDEIVTLFSKLALTYPPEPREGGEVQAIGFNQLAYDQALSIDCDDVRRDNFSGALPEPNIEGFLVLQSPRRLDVTGLYSSATLDGHDTAFGQASTHTEQIRERERQPSSRKPESRPDLMPIDARCVPPAAGQGNIPRSAMVTVRNGGPGMAAASTLGATYSAGPPASVGVPALPPGGTHQVEMSFPRSCKTTCEITFTADTEGVIVETDETNNEEMQLCLALPG